MDDMIQDALNKNLISFEPAPDFQKQSRYMQNMLMILGSTQKMRAKWELELDMWAWRN
jgi:hypothetical protein